MFYLRQTGQYYLWFCSFSLSSIVFLKMLRLQKIYSSPVTETASLTQMVLLVMGLFFSPTNRSSPLLPFFCVRLSASFLLSLFLRDISFFLQKEDVSGSLIYLLFFHTLSLPTFATLSLLDLHFFVNSSFNTWFQLSFKLANRLLFLISYCFISSPSCFLLCCHLPSLDSKRRSGSMGKTIMSFLKCKVVPTYS